MQRALILIACLTLGGACRSSQEVRPEGAAVIIKDTHVHTRYCGHYRFGSQWYYIAMHRHGLDCGHEQVDGDWVLEE